MAAEDLKALFLKRVDAWPTKEVQCRGVELTIQALTRDEVMRLGEIESNGLREATMIAYSVTEPFRLTVEEAQLLRENSEPMELEEFTADIARLSGMDKKPKEAQTAAFKSVRDDPVA